MKEAIAFHKTAGVVFILICLTIFAIGCAEQTVNIDNTCTTYDEFEGRTIECDDMTVFVPTINVNNENNCRIRYDD